MSKRFIDTGFLDQRWIRKLPPEKKMFLIYLMLKCDNGGIIELDLDDASFWIGEKIATLDFLPSDYLIPLDDPCKFFMPKFIEWQYKDLSSNKFIVAQARQILEKYDLINSDFTLNLHKIHVNITQNVPNIQEQGIGKGIGIGKRLIIKVQKIKFADDVTLTEDENEKLIQSIGLEKTQMCYNILSNYKGANGKKYKSDYKAILNWVIKRTNEETGSGKYIPMKNGPIQKVMENELLIKRYLEKGEEDERNAAKELQEPGN